MHKVGDLWVLDEILQASDGQQRHLRSLDPRTTIHFGSLDFVIRCEGAGDRSPEAPVSPVGDSLNIIDGLDGSGLVPKGEVTGGNVCRDSLFAMVMGMPDPV